MLGEWRKNDRLKLIFRFFILVSDDVDGFYFGYLSFLFFRLFGRCLGIFRIFFLDLNIGMENDYYGFFILLD